MPAPMCFLKAGRRRFHLLRKTLMNVPRGLIPFWIMSVQASKIILTPGSESLFPLLTQRPVDLKRLSVQKSRTLRNVLRMLPLPWIPLLMRRSIFSMTGLPMILPTLKTSSLLKQVPCQMRSTKRSMMSAVNLTTAPMNCVNSIPEESANSRIILKTQLLESRTAFMKKSAI